MNNPIEFLGMTTSLLELLSFAMALIAIALVVQEKHWAWLFTIISSGLYAWVFVESKLYGDSVLQFVFIAVALYGWYQWLFGGKNHHTLHVSALSFKWRMRSISFWLLGYLFLAELLWHYTDTDVPKIDAFLTAGSLLGQYLVSKKKIENWLVWMFVDTLYVALYVYKGLMLTAILYAILTVLAYIGWRTWKKQIKTAPLTIKIHQRKR